jgi:large subunit ribosomal protein L9
MQVILTQDVAKVGDMGEVVKVADGFGRNFLLPRGLALPANSRNTREFKHQMEQIARDKERQRVAAVELVAKIEDISITIPRQVGDNDRLYGAVTNRDIETALAAEGFEVDRRKIVLDSPIRDLGVYKVPVKLHSAVRTHVRVWVTAI